MSNEFGVPFSQCFGISEVWMRTHGVFDPTLDVDSPLFIDPFLLPSSRYKDFSDGAFDLYEQHFTEIWSLLSACEEVGDKAWKGALKKFQFRETKGLGGTCLGYSKHSTAGHAFGEILSARALEWAFQVVKLGVKDPELFSAMSLFENGIGADLISDMITNITLPCIIEFNNKIYELFEAELGVKPPRGLMNLRELKALLPENPYSNQGNPVILLPNDILKHLPIADDARQISAAAASNADLRDRVNSHISEIFKIRTKKDKEATKRQAMESAAAFQTLLDLLKLIEKTPYDIYKDPEGLIQWRSVAQVFSASHKLSLVDDDTQDRVTRINNVASSIISQFQTLIEDNRMWQVFYVDGKPRHERFAQLLFFAIAKSYCTANDLDISPEADAGAGPVDFKFSAGDCKVVVEIKLSTNSKVLEGYEKQLAAYQRAEGTDYGHYVVIDVGKMGNKWDRLSTLVAANPHFSKRRKVHLIDGTPRESASKL